MHYHYKNTVGEVWTAPGYVALILNTAIKFCRIKDNRHRLQIYQMITLDLMDLEKLGCLLI